MSLRLLTLALASIALLPASQAPPFHWSGKLAANKAITIRGVNGPIHAEYASGADIEVTAIRTAKRSHPDEVKINAIPTADGYTVCALYPGDGNDCLAGKSNTHNNDTEVEFTVHVPAGVRFNGHTVNGPIDAKNLRTDVHATTVNGKIDISTSGNARASSVNGSISAVMGKVNWIEPRKIHTVNGSIDLDLPSTANTQIRAKTVNGAISTDFPLTVKGSFGSKSLSGTLGSGGHELEIDTVNGSIHVRKHNAGVI